MFSFEWFFGIKMFRPKKIISFESFRLFLPDFVSKTSFRDTIQISVSKYILRQISWDKLYVVTKKFFFSNSLQSVTKILFFGWNFLSYKNGFCCSGAVQYSKLKHRWSELTLIRSFIIEYCVGQGRGRRVCLHAVTWFLKHIYNHHYNRSEWLTQMDLIELISRQAISAPENKCGWLSTCNYLRQTIPSLPANIMYLSFRVSFVHSNPRAFPSSPCTWFAISNFVFFPFRS